MPALHKSAVLGDLRGLLFTDPSYESDVWCRYESDVRLKGWTMDYHGADCVDDGCRFTNFALLLVHPAYAGLIKPSDDLLSFLCPIGMELKETMVGMDTACAYLGPTIALNGDWQPEYALRTGSDGELGTAYELKDGDKVIGIVFLGFIDNDFGTKESVWDYLKSTFRVSE